MPRRDGQLLQQQPHQQHRYHQQPLPDHAATSPVSPRKQGRRSSARYSLPCVLLCTALTITLGCLGVCRSSSMSPVRLRSPPPPGAAWEPHVTVIRTGGGGGGGGGSRSRQRPATADVEQRREPSAREVRLEQRRRERDARLAQRKAWDAAPHGSSRQQHARHRSQHRRGSASDDGSAPSQPARGTAPSRASGAASSSESEVEETFLENFGYQR